MPLFLLLSLFFSSTVFAEQITCPSVSDIKQHFFNSWLPLYIEGEELASARDVEQFQKNVSGFTVARWDRDYLESGHCFYQGNDPILNKIVFARDAWRPTTNNYWVWGRPDVHAECRAMNVEDCGFIS